MFESCKLNLNDFHTSVEAKILQRTSVRVTIIHRSFYDPGSMTGVPGGLLHEIGQEFSKINSEIIFHVQEVFSMRGEGWGPNKSSSGNRTKIFKNRFGGHMFKKVFRSSSCR
jgi:hypothetical protein